MRARSNPSPLTVLVSLAYQDSDLILEQMGRSRKTESLDQAVKRIADFTGDDPYKIRNTALLRLSEYVASNFDDARGALRWLTDIDKKLGAWAACQVAREALRFVSEDEQRPRIAIEVTEAWVRGEASLARVKKARDAAWAAYYASNDADDDNDDDATNAAARAAAIAAAYAAAATVDAAYASPAASSAASASAYNAYDASEYDAWDAVRDADIQRLVGVVADAIMSFP